MDISIEISFYPLAKEAFKDEIWAFIDTLNAVEGLTVVTNGMSTQVFGEYDLAMSTVTQQIKKCIRRPIAPYLFVNLLAVTAHR